jgi:HTH-type transcriptional regulator/antitoxin HigA
MGETIRAARAVAPGRIILRELDARGWSQQDLATIMGRPKQTISEIVRAKKQITAETALQLAKALGTSPEFWLNLEMHYQLHRANKEDSESEIERRSRLYHLAPINELLKRGWMRAVNTTEELEQEYCRFFRVAALDQLPQVEFLPRISDERGPEDRAVVAWIRRVEQLAMKQPVRAFSKERLQEFVGRLLEFSFNERDIEKIPALFLENGIHFLLVPHLPKTYLDGAALWVGDQPVVALSLRYDRIDAFWFTLLHEMAHIFKRQEQVDQLFDSGNQHLLPEEVEANRQAMQWLIPEEAMSEFIEVQGPRYSHRSIEEFAREQKRHPGIVIGQLMHRGEIKYSQLREYLVKVRLILAKWDDTSYPH